MYFLNNNNYNIVTFPKVGCTFLIKLCTISKKEYENHGHNFENNFCKKNKTIHNCGRIMNNKNFIENKPIIVIYRYPHERILSFYYANYGGKTDKKALRLFILNILKNPNLYNGFN
jgi:hypothetical protein